MKGRKWWYVIITLLVILFALYFYNKDTLPKLNGNKVNYIQIVDLDLNTVAYWHLFDKDSKVARDKIETVLGAFESYKPSVTRNYKKPNYWFHIGTETGQAIDYLVWMEKDEQSSFLYGDANIYNNFGIGDLNAYPISDEARDNILMILEKEK